MRAIDADALIALIEETICKPCIERKRDYNRVRCRACQYGDEIDDIDSAPTIEPKKGKWIERGVSTEKAIDEWQSARCSVCGKYHTTPYMYYFDEFNFCPNCGSYNGGDKE